VSWILTWLRVLAAVGMLGCSAVSTRLGCGGNKAVVSLPQANYVWMARHNAKVAETRQRGREVRLLIVGDSIAENYESSEEPYLNFRPIWDELFAPRGAMNLGFSADRTYNVLWRLRHGEVDGLAPRNIVLLIGTNNLHAGRLEPHGETAEQVSAGTLAVVDELHARMPDARVLVLSILPTSFSSDRTAKTDAANARVQAAIAKLSFARYLDVSGIFMDGKRLREELFYDRLKEPGAAALHPGIVGQRRMSEAILTALDGAALAASSDTR
jgi:lysophospholipase L1-like esterase